MHVPRKPIAWPDDSYIAVLPAVCFETWPEELGKPGSAQASFRKEFPEGSLFKTDIAVISDHLYGERNGAHRVLNVFKEFGIKTTWFLNGAGVEAFPDIAKLILGDGHELGSENWRHDYAWRQTREQQKDDLERTIAAFQKNLGIRPFGFISPGERPTDDTPELLAELGYEYYCGTIHEDLPYTLQTKKGEITVIRYGIWLNDHMLAYALRKDPRALLQWEIDEFDQLYEEGRQGSPGMMVLGIHPFIAGRPFRAKALREFFAYATSKPKVWFPKAIDIARHYKKNYGDAYVDAWPNYGTGIRRPKQREPQRA
jgi:peptidoglycan/xylan/chitin deacetylase (PgdA/CDA1 family)